MGLGPVEHLEPRTQITIRPFSWVPIYTQHLFCYLLWLLSKLKKITYAFSTLSKFTWPQFCPPCEKLPSFSRFQIQGIKEGLLFARCREGIQFWISLWLGGVTVHWHRRPHVRLWEECGGWQCWRAVRQDASLLDGGQVKDGFFSPTALLQAEKNNSPHCLSYESGRGRIRHSLLGWCSFVSPWRCWDSPLAQLGGGGTRYFCWAIWVFVSASRCSCVIVL